MKKLTVLLMALMLLLCAAALAESQVIDISDEENGYMNNGGTFVIPVDGDITLTGSANVPVVLQYKQGVVTLDNLHLEGGLAELKIRLHEEASASGKTVAVKLVGENTVIVESWSYSSDTAVGSALPLKFTGSGSLTVSSDTGLGVAGDITVAGGTIAAIGDDSLPHDNELASAIVAFGELNVTGGRLTAYGANRAFIGVNDAGEPVSKVNAGSGYVIKAGDSSETAKIVGSYAGETYLEIFPDPNGSVPTEPDMPATGDGANLALWTLMLAASVIGMLSMRRRAY